MPYVNFKHVDDAKSYAPIPDGEYLMQVAEAKNDTGKKGEFIVLKLEIVDGKYAGRTVFDRIYFNEDSAQRAKLICHRLGGIAKDYEGEITPDMFQAKRALVTIVENTYENRDGKTVKNNKVTFDGYKPFGLDPEMEAAFDQAEKNIRALKKEEDDIPAF